MSGIVTCPLDVIKTKLQAQGGFRAAQARKKVPLKAAVYNGMLGTGKVILTEEGVRGLYRGLGPIILGYLPTWAVWFTVYGKAKAYISTTDSMCRFSLFSFLFFLVGEEGGEGLITVVPWGSELTAHAQ